MGVDSITLYFIILHKICLLCFFPWKAISVLFLCTSFEIDLFVRLLKTPAENEGNVWWVGAMYLKDIMRGG